MLVLKKSNKAINLLNMPQTPDIQKKLIGLEESQNDTIAEIIEHKNQFLALDRTLQEEIDKAIRESKKKWCRFSCLKT